MFVLACSNIWIWASQKYNGLHIGSHMCLSRLGHAHPDYSGIHVLLYIAKWAFVHVFNITCWSQSAEATRASFCYVCTSSESDAIAHWLAILKILCRNINCFFADSASFQFWFFAEVVSLQALGHSERETHFELLWHMLVMDKGLQC